MKITINDRVGFSAEEVIKLAYDLLENRKPKEGSFDYGLTTHGIFGVVANIKLPYPIQVSQENDRVSAKSPIVIGIKKHNSIL